MGQFGKTMGEIMLEQAARDARKQRILGISFIILTWAVSISVIIIAIKLVIS